MFLLIAMPAAVTLSELKNIERKTRQERNKRAIKRGGNKECAPLTSSSGAFLDRKQHECAFLLFVELNDAN